MVDPLVELAIGRLGSVPDAAKKLSVSKSLLYMVMRGEREPSEELLEKLGLERIQVISQKK